MLAYDSFLSLLYCKINFESPCVFFFSISMCISIMQPEEFEMKTSIAQYTHQDRLIKLIHFH